MAMMVLQDLKEQQAHRELLVLRVLQVRKVQQVILVLQVHRVQLDPVVIHLVAVLLQVL
jgi:hypothetical protein